MGFFGFVFGIVIVIAITKTVKYLAKNNKEGK